MKSLNESPSEKEGKWARLLRVNGAVEVASMKVPPKRKGNTGAPEVPAKGCCLNESPSEKEGKFLQRLLEPNKSVARLNESPSEKEGKSGAIGADGYGRFWASMKVPPKRKGNSVCDCTTGKGSSASMKVPPKRKGNSFLSN